MLGATNPEAGHPATEGLAGHGVADARLDTGEPGVAVEFGDEPGEGVGVGQVAPPEYAIAAQAPNRHLL